MRFRLIDIYVISFHRKGYLMLCFNQVFYIKIKTDIKQVLIIIYFQAKKLSIRETLKDILPAGGKAILFGSQARDEAREDSDWDILILLDKTRIEANDYDTISYPLRELGWKFKACINPVMYTMKDWLKYSFSPFYHNVTKDGIELI